MLGIFDENLQTIARELELSCRVEDTRIHLEGEAENAAVGAETVKGLLSVLDAGESIDKSALAYCIALAREGKAADLREVMKGVVAVTSRGKPVKCKTVGQRAYVDGIRKNGVTFGIGPAGTGKTYLAMAMAITAFKNNEVSRIILTRPAIEAGEKLGFLPGDLQSKVDPYLRPLYDALYQIMGPESFLHNTEKGLIEVAPLAYMRGRTLDNAYIILDEAQNTTPAQMKMFLTRIGFGSKVIITGDQSQKDLPQGTQSGLDVAIRVLDKVEDIGFCYMTSQDVVRHPLVQKIVKAYEDYESRINKDERKRQRAGYERDNRTNRHR